MGEGALAAEAEAQHPKRRGRPPDPGRDDAILSCTIELLGEVGYDRLRVGDIAERAGVGLGTIYRRWPTKVDVVVAAISQLAEAEVAHPLPEDPVDAYVSALCGLVDSLRGPGSDLVPGMASEVRHHDELRRAYRAAIVEPRRETFRQVVRGARPDLDAAAVDLLADLGPALVLFRTVFAYEEPDETLVRELVGAYIEPVLTDRRPASRRPGSTDGRDVTP